MNKDLQRLGGTVLWITVGLVIGSLVGALGGDTFRNYVINFYPPSYQYSRLLHALSGASSLLHPVTGFCPTLGALYYCRRRQLKTRYVFWTGLGGFLLAFLFDSYVTADPGPNFHTSEHTAPMYCFAGTVLGVWLQAADGDWIRRVDESP